MISESESASSSSSASGSESEAGRESTGMDGAEVESADEALRRYIRTDDVEHAIEIFDERADVLKDGFGVEMAEVAKLESGQPVGMTGGRVLHLAAYFGSVKVAAEVLKRRVDVDVRTGCKVWTPLLLACVRRKLSMINLLAGHGADLQVQLAYGGEVPLTALRIAAKCCADSVLEVLLRAGARVNQSSATGDSALFNAIKQSHVKGVKLLLEHGANPRHGPDGSTALHFAAACSKASADVVEMLLQNGAVASASNANGETAAELAKAKGHSKIAKILKEAEYSESAQPARREGGRVLVHVRGPGGSGKSTLIETLKGGNEPQHPAESHLSTGDSDDGTAGVMTSSYSDPTSGTDITFVEFGGHERYEGSNARFHLNHVAIGVPTVLLVVVSGMQTAELMERDVVDVCQEYCALQPAPETTMSCETEGDDRLRIPVLVAFTRLASMSQVDRARCSAVLFTVRERVGGTALSVRDRPLFVGTWSLRHEEAANLRRVLVQVSTDVLAVSTESKIVRDVLPYMPEVRSRIGQSIVSSSEFLATAANVISPGAGQVELLAALSRDSGSILHALNGRLQIEWVASADLVAAQPRRLWSSAVDSLVRQRDIGVVKEPVELQIHREPIKNPRHPSDSTHMKIEKPHSTEYGRVPGDAVRHALPDLAPGLALAVAEHLTGGVRVADGDDLFFVDPVESKRETYFIGKWPYDAQYQRFAGRRLRCAVSGRAFSRAFATAAVASLFARLRSAAADDNGDELLVWRDGVAGRARGGDAEVALMIAGTREHLDVVVRSRSNDRRLMYALLSAVRADTLSLWRRLSPGAAVRELVMSPSEVAFHVQLDPWVDRARYRMVMHALYELTAVDAALPENAVLRCDAMYYVDRALDTLRLPADHVALMSRETRAALLGLARRRGGGGETPTWRRIASLLGATAGRVAVLAEMFPADPLAHVLDEWGARGSGCTVREMMRLLAEDDVGGGGQRWSDALALLRDELNKPFIGSPNVFDVMPKTVKAPADAARARATEMKPR